MKPGPNNATWNSPYKFNGKEQDEETGLYYYGARYYNPQVSVWLSVDAMASKGPNITPYAFSHNNPVMLVDPDGNWPDGEESKTTNETVIFGVVDENNTTHVIQNSVESTSKKLNDGTVVIDQTITEVNNQVRNSDGEVTKGMVNTYSRTGIVDADGNTSYCPSTLVSSRAQEDGEFKDLNSWTGFISNYSANSKENYNIQSFTKGSALTVFAGVIGTLPVALFAGGTLSLPANTATVLRALKIPLNVSSATGVFGGGIVYHLGPNNGYLQIYGVSQSYNGVLMKQMRQPK